MAYDSITWWQIDGEKIQTMRDFILGGLKITVDSDCSHEMKRHPAPWKKSYDKPGEHIKKQRHHFAYKGPYNQRYGFSSHIWMWELDDKKGWAPKNWCFQTVVLKKTLESPLDSKEIQPVTPKGSESCSVMSDSLWPHRLYSPWNSPGQNTGVGNLSLLQEIFPTQGSSPGLLHCRQILILDVYLKVAKRVNLKSSYHKGKKWGGGLKRNVLVLLH